MGDQRLAGVLIVAACIVGGFPLGHQFGCGPDRRADRSRRADPQLAGDRAARPHQGRAVLRNLRRHGAPHRPVVDRAAGRPAQPQHSGPQLRDQSPQGQRRRREPGGDRGDRRLAGRRYRPGGLRRRRLRQLRRRCRPSRRCATSRPRDRTTTPPARARRCAARPMSLLESSPQEMAERVAIAGVEIIEVRISHLAYAPEIAQAMLRRQQANAVVAARSRIVEGAVGMVEPGARRSMSAASSSSTRSARRRWSAT